MNKIVLDKTLTEYSFIITVAENLIVVDTHIVW